MLGRAGARRSGHTVRDRYAPGEGPGVRLLRRTVGLARRAAPRRPPVARPVSRPAGRGGRLGLLDDRSRQPAQRGDAARGRQAAPATRKVAGSPYAEPPDRRAAAPTGIEPKPTSRYALVTRPSSSSGTIRCRRLMVATFHMPPVAPASSDPTTVVGSVGTSPTASVAAPGGRAPARRCRSFPSRGGPTARQTVPARPPTASTVSSTPNPLSGRPSVSRTNSTRDADDRRASCR